VAYSFQIGKKKIKLLTEYKSVTQEGLFLVDSTLQNAKQHQHARIYSVIFGFKLKATRSKFGNMLSRFNAVTFREIVSSTKEKFLTP
jgi:hypothetical protein